MPHIMGDLSFPTRDRNFTPWIGRQTPSHWATREFPTIVLFNSSFHQLTVMFIGIFMFLLCWVLWTSWICAFILFIICGYFSAVIYSNPFSAPSHVSPLDLPLHVYYTTLTNFLCSFSPHSVFLCVYHLIIFILTLQIHWFLSFFYV